MKIILLAFVALQAPPVKALKIATPKDAGRHPHWGGDPIEKLMLKVNHVSEVKPPSRMETVRHDKEADGGYKKGSPLYTKQEKIAQQSDDKEPKKKAMTEAEGAQPFSVPLQKLESALAPEARKMMPGFHELVAYMSVYAIFVFAFAYVYWKRQPFLTGWKREPPIENLPRCGFMYSCLDCSNLSSDWPVCLWAWCCPIVQWAGTASKPSTHFLSYWKAVTLMLVLAALIPFTYGLTALVILVILFVRRRKIRKDFNHKSPEHLMCLWDTCLIFCCNSFLCCQLVQEAREVECKVVPSVDHLAGLSTVPRQHSPSLGSATSSGSMHVQQHKSLVVQTSPVLGSSGSMPVITPHWAANQSARMANQPGSMQQQWVRRQ